jgi:hypothetical protein
VKTRGTTFSRVLLVGAVTAGLATIGTPATSASLSAPFAANSHTVTLITGDQVSVRTSANGKPTFSTRPAAGSGGFVSYQDGTGDRYVVPAVALPYLGRQLDPSLFDVSAMIRDGVTGTLPLRLSFGAGVRPTAPDLTSGTAFTAALHKRIGADIAAGHQAGASGLPDGLAGISRAGNGAPGPVVGPFFPLHILQINATDATGQPAADLIVLLVNTDSSTRENGFVPVVNGIGRIGVPAGNYSALTVFDDFDAQGNLSATRLVTAADFTVADAPTVSTVTLDERTATSALSGTTPRPTIADVSTASAARIDATGANSASASASNAGFPAAKVFVKPQAAAKIGTLHYVAQWGGAATRPADGYRYDLAFGANDIPADQTVVGRSDQVATVHEHLFADPAGGTDGTLLTAALDPSVNFFDEVGVIRTMPSDFVDYLGTADGGEWIQADTTPNGVELQGDPHTYAAGHEYSVDWARGPLAAGLTQWTSPQFCDACTAGSTLSLAIPIVRDTVPDHAGSYAFFVPGTTHFTLYRDDVKLFDQDGFFGAAVTGIPATPSTYRGVLDVNLSGATTFSQSTRTHTEITVKYTPTASDSPLPTADICAGQTTGTACQILPALTLDYRLATDGTNTSHSPVQTMGLRVGHVSYQGVGSHSPIRSATVAFSFDNGQTWQPASIFGFDGQYVAVWPNQAGGSPELRVTATDAAGDAITQTITNAYTIATGSIR